MTLLVAQVRLPVRGEVHSDTELLSALVQLGPRLITYLMSFVTLGLYWVAQATEHNLMARADRHATWLHLGFLAVVVLMPLSTDLLTEFIHYRAALLCYWLNIALIGLGYVTTVNYAARAGLLKTEVDAKMIAAIRRRVVVSQCLFALGAVLCVLGTWVSIGFIFLVQLNYAFGSPVRWVRRLTT